MASFASAGARRELRFSVVSATHAVTGHPARELEQPFSGGYWEAFGPGPEVVVLQLESKALLSCVELDTKVRRGVRGARCAHGSLNSPPFASSPPSRCPI